MRSNPSSHGLDKTGKPATLKGWLASTIKQKILSGEYSAGSLLDSERGLSKKCGISRATVRSTLDLLARIIEGLEASSVSIDYFNGTLQATNHLSETWSRPVHYIGYRQGNSTLVAMLAGWQHSLTNHGIQEMGLEIGEDIALVGHDDSPGEKKLREGRRYEME